MKFKKIAFLFPGQGAQTVGMGKDFYQSFSLAREVYDEGESLLKLPLKNIIFEGPEDRLKETRYSQTAIFLTSYALCMVLQKQFPSLKPSLTAGLSLGEYTALVVSGHLSMEECLPLVHYRGECMHQSCEAHVGAMAAILGLSSVSVKDMVKEVALPQDLWVANFNSPEQTVISGTPEGIAKATLCAKERGAKKIIPLKVQGAFHSGLMQTAQDKLKHRIDFINLRPSAIDLAMNVTGCIVKDPCEIRRLLIKQVVESVQWEQTMHTIEKEKCDLILEIGPGKTLTGLVKQNGLSIPALSINRIEDLETVNHLING